MAGVGNLPHVTCRGWGGSARGSGSPPRSSAAGTGFDGQDSRDPRDSPPSYGLAGRTSGAGGGHLPQCKPSGLSWQDPAAPTLVCVAGGAVYPTRPHSGPGANEWVVGAFDRDCSSGRFRSFFWPPPFRSAARTVTRQLPRPPRWPLPNPQQLPSNGPPVALRSATGPPRPTDPHQGCPTSE